MLEVENMHEKYRSIFDIVGPVMVGPSSSHTAGAAQIGRKAGQLLRTSPEKIKIDYYESFAKTHLGHGTDLAIVGGTLGMGPEDPSLACSLEIIKKQGIPLQINESPKPSPSGHPNTAMVTLWSGKYKVALCGCSIGGGKIEIKQVQINGHSVELPGPLPVVLLTSTPEAFVKILEEFARSESVITAQNFCPLDSGENLYALNLKKVPVKGWEDNILKYCRNLICL